MPQLPLGFSARAKREEDSVDDETPRGPRIFTVTEVTSHLRRALEARYRTVCVRGEIASLKLAGSGHAYFGLKDRRANIRCVMWRDQVQGLKFRPATGREVVATGRITVYEKSGDLQLVVDTLEPAGIGALHEAYEQCVAKLKAEGLTASERKKRLPPYPARIGVVTSLSGAALRDVVRTILRRDPRAHVIVSDARVQGRGAAFQIVAAIRRLDEAQLTDVILVCRGGGSLEDLWAFNEEPVARAISIATTPIVTGIGHETDTTIADLVADFRASTPTAAAEHAVPIRREIRDRLLRLEARLSRNLSARVTARSRDLHKLTQRLRDPSLAIRRRAQLIDDLSGRAERALRTAVRSESAALAKLERRLAIVSPTAKMARARHRLDVLDTRLDRIAKVPVDGGRARLSAAIQRLEALSPLAVLGRGYAVVRAEDGTIVREASALSVDDDVSIRLGAGTAAARITTTKPSDG